MNLFTQPMLRKPFFYVSKLSVVILASLLLSPQTLLAYRASAAVGLGAAQAKSKVLRNVAQSEPEKPAPTLTQVVQQVTVQVVTDRNRGSGTLIGRQGKKYLVLTNQHVVRGGQRIQIRTYDGQNYTGQVMKEGVQGENDLALVQFESEKSYTIPDIATATPKQGLNIVSAGYAAESGQFLVSKGQLQQLPSQPLKEGYRLGYSGKVEQGMSGGPVFVFDTEENPEPFLIGINGRSAFPIVSNYAYQDGSNPSASEVQTMRQVNWGLPIQTVLAQIKPDLLISFGLTPPEGSVAVKTDQKNLPAWAKAVEVKARQVSVRIDSDCGEHGSGVMIAKQGNVYTVLTAEHVVSQKIVPNSGCTDKTYTVMTHDGKQYRVNPSSINRQEGVDLAVVQFESGANYPLATLAKYSPKPDAYVFAAGYPKIRAGEEAQWFFSGGTIFEKELGTLNVNSYSLKTEGTATAKSLSSFSSGYELVYTSITYGGMSGGAIFDHQGQVIGIHGLADGVTTAGKTKIQLGYSLGIPASTVVGILKQWNLSEKQVAVQSAQPQDLEETQQIELATSLGAVEVGADNGNASTWIERGNQLWRLGRYTKAVTAFDRAIALNSPLAYLAWYGKGLALAYGNQREEAMKALIEAEVEAEKQNPTYLVPILKTQSAVYRKLKQYDKALIAIEKAIKKQPVETPDPASYSEKYVVLSELKRYPEALAAIEQAIKITPRAAFYTNRGTVHAELKEYDKAIADYEQAISINPQFAQAYYNRGVVYYELKEYDKAIADYKEAIMINPQFALAYYNRGVVYYELKEYDKAITDYSKAILINPQLGDTYYNRGLVYAKLKEYGKAITDCDKAISINPQDALAYTNRGNVYAKLKDYDKAIADYSKAILINPQDALAYTNRGNVYAKLKDYDKAIADYDKAISLNSQYAQAYANRGLTYALQGNIPQEKQDLQTAAQLFQQQNNPAAYNQVMQFLQQL